MSSLVWKGCGLKPMDFLRGIYLRTLGRYHLSALFTREIAANWTILDIGCGRDSSLRGLNAKRFSVGLDIYMPYLLQSRKSAVHSDYVLADAKALPFRAETVDCAVATELLEHLNKPDGLTMLTEIERVVKRKILMTTPNGFLPTYAGPDDNPEETHLSGYTLAELRNLGYQVHGFHGAKRLWKIKQGRAVLRFRPEWLFYWLRTLSELIAFNRPASAFQFFFTKDLRGSDRNDLREPGKRGKGWIAGSKTCKDQYRR
jgi:2-polyprenyl-3-methyl-5-hydroxy-6-metoxy-1,4-benzoquinol methylase